MTFLLFQKGPTNLGFQIGKVFCYINLPRFWKTSGFFGRGGIDRSKKETKCTE